MGTEAALFLVQFVKWLEPQLLISLLLNKTHFSSLVSDELFPWQRNKKRVSSSLMHTNNKQSAKIKKKRGNDDLSLADRQADMKAVFPYVWNLIPEQWSISVFVASGKKRHLKQTEPSIWIDLPLQQRWQTEREVQFTPRNMQIMLLFFSAGRRTPYLPSSHRAEREHLCCVFIFRKSKGVFPYTLHGRK